MGQKINPIGFRLSVNKNWSARWFANSRNFSRLLLEDIRVREYLTKKLAHASLGHIRIERPTKNARVTLYSARPGMIIGKKGEDIEVLRTALQKIAGVPVQVNIEDIRKPELNAQLIAASIASQLERRIMFRRAMKRAMQNAMKLGGLGIKIMSSGRLNGAEIARTEWYREGRVPLHTLRADIDYVFAEAKTTYGVIGIKVWVYKGETPAPGEQVQMALPEATAAPDVTRQEFVRSIMGAETVPAEPTVKTVRRKVTPQVAEPVVNSENAKKRVADVKSAPGKRPATAGVAGKEGTARPKRIMPKPTSAISAAGDKTKAPAKKPSVPKKAKTPTDEKS